MNFEARLFRSTVLLDIDNLHFDFSFFQRKDFKISKNDFLKIIFEKRLNITALE